MKLFGIYSFVVLTLVEGIPLSDFDGKDYRPARKLKVSKIHPVPKKVLLGYYLPTEAKEKTRRFSVGTTSNIPANGEPKCLETTEGSGISGVCVGDIKVQSGLPVYSDTGFQNKIALAYETSSITDVDPTIPETISIDSSVLKFSSTNDKGEPNEIRFGGLVTNGQLKRVVDGGFGKYEGATGYIAFEYVADIQAWAMYHLY